MNTCSGNAAHDCLVASNRERMMPANSGAEGNAVGVLRDLRDSIDNIDAAIIHMLAERFRCTQRVGVL